MTTATRDFARNATLNDLSVMLQEQQTRKVDIVAPARSIRSRKGVLRIKDVEPYIDDDGVTLASGYYRPTSIADEGMADKLGIPLAYMRRLRTTHTPLLDDNINGWLARDERKFLIRCFRGDEQGSDRKVPGMARAFLSDRFAIMDNLDALLAALDGVRAAGVEVNIAGCDLTERRMTVRIECPAVATLAPTLLAGYRSPFPQGDGPHTAPDDDPVVFAGFVLSNSETGGGAYTLTPRITIKVCKNGLTVNRDAMRAVHLGSTLEPGTVKWSAETQTRAVALVRSKTVDAVRAFLTPEYLNAVVGAMEQRAGEEVADVDAVRKVTKAVAFTEAQTDDILGFFIRGGQMTGGGVANAATAYAQTVDDPEVAAQMEAGAARLLVGA
jgi:hypothetical protein